MRGEINGLFDDINIVYSFDNIDLYYSENDSENGDHNYDYFLETVQFIEKDLLFLLRGM